MGDFFLGVRGASNSQSHDVSVIYFFSEVVLNIFYKCGGCCNKYFGDLNLWIDVVSFLNSGFLLNV